MERELGLRSATFIVIASMIGPGIFITSGPLLELTGDPLLILLLWAVGGIIAVTGSLCYAELSAVWPHAGGEYVYLKKIFGMPLSFLAGWVSLLVGFSAAIAISAISLIEYSSQLLLGYFSHDSAAQGLLENSILMKGSAIAFIVLFSIVHMLGIKFGGTVQNYLTGFKIAFILLLIGAGLYMADWSMTHRLTEHVSSSPQTERSIPTIGLALLIIMYSYSGWNGATYVAEEIKKPEKNLPKAMLYGSIITTVLYLFLNIIFLIGSPAEQIAGKESIGLISARNLFSPAAFNIFAIGIILIILSSLSVNTMIGPRVYYAMAKDGLLFRALGRLHPRYRVPTLSIVIQMILAIVYVLFGNPRLLMEYLGFALGIFPVFAVAGLIYMRMKHPEIERPYRVPLYPLIPLFFIIISSLMLITGFAAGTYSSRIAAALLIAGVPVFYIWHIYIYKKQGISGDSKIRHENKD